MSKDPDKSTKDGWSGFMLVVMLGVILTLFIIGTAILLLAKVASHNQQRRRAPPLHLNSNGDAGVNGNGSRGLQAHQIQKFDMGSSNDMSPTRDNDNRLLNPNQASMTNGDCRNDDYHGYGGNLSAMENKSPDVIPQCIKNGEAVESMIFRPKRFLSI